MKKIIYFVLICSWLVTPISGLAIAQGWNTAAAILERIKTPVFPDHDFLITAFGAKPDMNTLNTVAIRKAIEACSEAGGCRNVFIENCKMDSPHLDRVLRIKSNAKRGGVIDSIFMRTIEVGQVTEAILTVDFLYEEGDKGNFPPTTRDIVIENVTSTASPRLFFITGFKGATIDRIRVANCVFKGVTATDVIEGAGKIELDNVTIIPAERTRSRGSRVAAE